VLGDFPYLTSGDTQGFAFAADRDRSLMRIQMQMDQNGKTLITREPSKSFACFHCARSRRPAVGALPRSNAILFFGPSLFSCILPLSLWRTISILIFWPSIHARILVDAGITPRDVASIDRPDPAHCFLRFRTM
jgi:hypothetical protein